MRCVKTGFTFKDSETGKIHTGDLFVSDGEFFIRGIPSDPEGVPVDFGDSQYDTVVYVGGYDRRERRNDSRWTVQIEQVTAKFRAHVAKWYPELVDKLTCLPLIA